MTISVIIPCRTKKDLCPELLPALKSQSLKPKEILIITNKLCPKSPAEKRDYGAKKAKGNLLAFIDSDAYPTKDWLKNASKHLKSPNVAAVCGPGLTPPNNSPDQQISGLVWSSPISAGPYTYRNLPKPQRFVDDYPSFNLIVKKKAFNAVGGFDTQYWPGEDTKLCLDLTHQLKQKILYHPSIQVFHHRRPIFLPHLAQISRYGFQRGRFVRLFPQTSLRLSYFLFPLWLITLPITWPLYLTIIITAGLYHRSLRLTQAIFLTHFTYALFFIKGLLFSNKK
jgi:cellulose synthase/poly-beta-1,6-N-acetylglucosamine synthase-like glycosyltransferase